MSLPKDILTVAELQKVLKQPDIETPLGYRNRMCLEILIGTGIRRIELCQLKVSDINFTVGTLLIENGKFQKDRVIPINHTALHYIHHYIKCIRAQQELPRHAAPAHLVISQTGKPIAPRHLNEILGKEIAKAGLKKAVTLHSFRHTFCTHLIQNGMPLRHVQLLMGHEDMNSTLVYVNLSVKELQREYKKAFRLD